MKWLVDNLLSSTHLLDGNAAASVIVFTGAVTTIADAAVH